MLGTEKSRGYGLEMICADLLAGANLDTIGFYLSTAGQQRRPSIFMASHEIIIL